MGSKDEEDQFYLVVPAPAQVLPRQARSHPSGRRCQVRDIIPASAVDEIS
jgi:hypothetical protein